jgi:predicted polyphosphate/ATP-dependent NAD kinase
VTKVGLIVNPVAGMGGSVGLKGTDGGMYERAVELGAEPVTPDRARAFLSHVERSDEVRWLAGPGAMGESYLADVGLPHEVVGEVDARTTAEDTRRVARRMVEEGADLLTFVGGDGTARDVHDAVDGRVPVVAVPAGVKVYSAVFALNPRSAAGLVDAFVEGTDVVEEEVLDIDEEAFREDRLDAQLYGYLKVPEAPGLLQPGKQATGGAPSVRENQRDVAAYVVEEMEPGALYLLGPGTTVRAVAEELGVDKTLLGVDAVVGGEPVGTDLNERAILALLDEHDVARVVVTPIGGNGFIFGRGNKPFTPEVLRRVEKEGVVVVSTVDKARSLPCLRVDTGDPQVDEMLAGYLEVIVGYRQARMMKVEA